MASGASRPPGWTPKNDWEPAVTDINNHNDGDNIDKESELQQDSMANDQQQQHSHSSSGSEEIDEDQSSGVKVKAKRIKRENYRKRSSDDDSENDKGDHQSRRKRSRSPRRKRSSSRHRHRGTDRAERRRRSRSRDRRRRNESSRRRSGDPRRRSRSRSKSRDRNDTSSSPKKARASSRDKRSRKDPERKSPSKRRSRSRSKSRSKRSRDRGSRRSRSRERRRQRSRSASRGRSSRSRRSRSRDDGRSKRSESKGSRPRRSRRSASTSPYRFGFDKAMDAQERLARRLERAKELTKLKREEEQKNIDEKGFLGLKEDKLKEAIENAAKMLVASAQPVPTSQEILSAQASAQMEVLRAKAEAETGISVPTYYNPLVVNPMTYAQQQAKRKKLWAKKEDSGDAASNKDNSKESLWSKMSLGDNKTDEKFAKLMGIKQTDQSKSDGSNRLAEETLKKQQELFSNLDMQYEQARISTHTQRGVGLGFSSALLNPNTVAAQQANQQLGSTTANPSAT